MNSVNNGSDSNYNSFESAYNRSFFRYLLYDGLRILQMIIGIIGNGMTLHIIRNLKVLKNGHILMTYMATSDILVNSVVPLGTFTTVVGTFTNRPRYWKTLCIWTDYVYLTVNSYSFIFNFILATDRYVEFILS